MYFLIKHLSYSVAWDIKLDHRIINVFYLNHHVLLICRVCLEDRAEKDSEVPSRVGRKAAMIDDR